jgi:hypothetical protein
MAEKRAGRRDSSNKYSSHLLIHVLICKPGTSPLVATAQDQRPVCAGSQSNNNLCHPRACDGRGCQRRFDMASGRKDSDFSTGCTIAIDGLDLVGRAAVVGLQQFSNTGDALGRLQYCKALVFVLHVSFLRFRESSCPSGRLDDGRIDPQK